MKQRGYLDIVIRYLLLIIVAIPNLYIFYTIFTPLTIYPVYFLLKIFFNATLSNNIIVINHISIEVIQACIAGSAYYLLFILNLSIPHIKIKKRLKMIGIAFLSLLILNILRILLLVSITLYNPSLFDITHKVFWYALSIFFVIGIWFAEVKFFKIKQIPFYSDINFLYQKIAK